MSPTRDMLWRVMPPLSIPTPSGLIPAYVSHPDRPGPWPGVVVVHDALGMTDDLRHQTHWLAESGYLAAAPDLLHGGGHLRCLYRVMRDLAQGRQGPAFDALAATRSWLSDHPNASGRVGIIGFCLGGGFALMLATGAGYDVSAPNYGALAEREWDSLANACPIVASYGADDPTLRGAAARLEHTLSTYGVAHDVKEYPGVGHGFMNEHPPQQVKLLFRVLGRLSNTRYDASATADARARIIAFFDEHLHASRT